MPETTPVTDRPVTSRPHHLTRLMLSELRDRFTELADRDKPVALELLTMHASRDVLINVILTLESGVVSDDLAADERQ